MLRARLFLGVCGIAFLVTAGATAAHAAGPTLEWDATRDFESANDGGLLSVADENGGVFVIGATPLSQGGEDMIIIKYDADGVEQWHVLYQGSVEGGYDYPEGAVVDANGNLYITGQSGADDVNFSQEWVTLKLSGMDGSVLWDRRFRGTGTFGGSTSRAMAMGPGGEIVVTGWARDDNTLLDFGVVKYAPDGTEVWSRLFSSPGFRADAAEAVDVGPDGSIAVVGRYAVSDSYIIGVVKYDASGTLQWWDTYDASSFFNLEDRVESVVIDEQGNVYVGADGINNSTEGRDFVLLKYAPDGTPLWDRRVVTSTGDVIPVVLLGPEGNVYLCGPSDTGHRVVAFDADGNQLWTRRHAGSVHDGSQRDHAAIDADGNLAIMLRSLFAPGITAFTIVRYAPDGTIVDETTIDPEGQSRYPGALSANELGNLFAVGNWQPISDRDVLTYKLAFGAPGAAGDLDRDGDVDTADFAVFAQCFGGSLLPPAANCPAGVDADLDADGDVDTADFAILAQNFTG